MLPVLSMLFLGFLSFLLIVIVLLQRGRGGGLAGAFGGMGGQSAFGTRAGDVFTKITIGFAVAWVLTAGLSGWAMYSGARSKFEGGNDATTTISPAPGSEDDRPALPGAGAGLPPQDDSDESVLPDFQGLPGTPAPPAGDDSSDDGTTDETIDDPSTEPDSVPANDDATSESE